MSTPLEPSEPPQDGVIQSLKKWGENSFNPMILATLIAPQHLRPLQPIGGIFFPGSLVFSSFLSLHGYKKDAAGVIAAQSGLYMLLASRRGHRIREKLSPRGILRGTTLGLCAVNVVACGIAYAFGDRQKEAEARGDVE